MGKGYGIAGHTNHFGPKVKLGYFWVEDRFGQDQKHVKFVDNFSSTAHDSYTDPRARIECSPAPISVAVLEAQAIKRKNRDGVPADILFGRAEAPLQQQSLLTTVTRETFRSDAVALPPPNVLVRARQSRIDRERREMSGFTGANPKLRK